MGAPLRSDYRIDWRETAEGLVPFVERRPREWVQAAWAPQYGSQFAFLRASSIFEVLYEGTRGPGKTDALLMDFLQHVGRGYGAEWRGIIFRRTFPELGDVIEKSKKWIPRIFPGATYNQQDHRWTFPDGETLYFRFIDTPEDYWKYHGHAFPWIAFEELCTWPNDKCYKVMMSCCRSTKVGMPRCYRATANPYGPGHNWVKARFKLPQMRGKVIRGTAGEPPRVAIFGHIVENQVLLRADPEYLTRIRAAARNASELAAWIDGSWDIIAGGMFDDVWDHRVNVVPPVPLHKLPKRWKFDRTFDWGSSRPFAVLWWAESNGEPFEFAGHVYGKVRGDLYAIQEWYGWNGVRNEGVRALAGDIAEGIIDRQEDWQIAKQVRPGPADSQIFDRENDNCVAADMLKKGVGWLKVEKGPGSRKQGWEQMRKLMAGAKPIVPGTPREVPGLFVFSWCEQFLETVPSLPRSDKDLDDVDSDAEDHLADAARYRIRKKKAVEARRSSMN